MNLFTGQLNRGKELKEILNKASKAYYGYNGEDSSSLLSDEEYDALYNEYVELEKQFPELNDTNSPTKLVGAEVVSELEKVNHLSPLLSINLKSQNEEDLRKWYRGLGGNGIEIIVQPKFDGLTVDLVYNNALTYGATRGNGYIGELITHNIKTISSIPSKIDFDGLFEVRGEGILYMSDFMERFKEYSNPRNLAAGTLRQLDSSLCAAKNPDVVFYDLGKCDKQFTTDVEQIEFIKSLGFKTAPYILVDNEDDLVSVCISRMNGMIPLVNGFNVLETEGDVTDIMCDGLVLKVNDIALREKLGFTQKGPRFASAFKFKSLTAITTLKEVISNTRRTGRIAPVAIFDEINLGGVSITNATLNNYDFINSLPLVNEEGEILELNYGVKIGDEILVSRSNDVIPKVIGVIRRGIETKDIIAPEICSTCGGPIIKDGALHFCENINCKSRLKGSLELFVSRDAMNIMDFGLKNIDLFVDREYIKSIVDVYSLKEHRDEITKIKGYGVRKVDKILKSIEGSKEQPFERVLYSLGISSVGKRMSKTLIKKYNNIDNLIAATRESLLEVEDVGPETADKIIHFFSNAKNIEMINQLREIGLCFEAVEEKGSSIKLQGKSFVITGTLSNSRNYYANIIEKNGGKVAGSVSKKTFAVVIGEDAGSKETKARTLVASGAAIRLVEGDNAFVELMKEFDIEI